jgi:hypothetical protein
MSRELPIAPRRGANTRCLAEPSLVPWHRLQASLQTRWQRPPRKPRVVETPKRAPRRAARLRQLGRMLRGGRRATGGKRGARWGKAHAPPHCEGRQGSVLAFYTFPTRTRGEPKLAESMNEEHRSAAKANPISAIDGPIPNPPPCTRIFRFRRFCAGHRNPFRHGTRS